MAILNKLKAGLARVRLRVVCRALRKQFFRELVDWEKFKTFEQMLEGRVKWFLPGGNKGDYSVEQGADLYRQPPLSL